MPTVSLRDQIMDTLALAIAGMSTDTYWATPQLVKREYINPLVTTRFPNVGIIETDEQKSDAGVGGSFAPFGFRDCHLSVSLLFADKAVNEIARSVLGNRWVSDLERITYATLDNKTIGGTVVRCAVRGNDLELTEIEAPLLMGAVYLDIFYTHKDGDPTRAT